MADASLSPRVASAADDLAPLPEVRLEMRGSGTRAASYDLTNVDFLIGSVPGCDLRLSGVETPLVLCIIARHSHGVTVRKLAPTQPLLRNGRPVTSATLAHGDRISVAGIELAVHIRAGAAPVIQPDSQITARQQELDARAVELNARQRLLNEQTADLEKDRVVWYQRREEMAREIQQRAVAVPASAAACPEDLDAQAGELGRQKQELAAARQEVVDIRTQLYERYRERRDRLAGLQEAVERAAQKVQENKRRVEADLQEVETQRRENETRHADLQKQAQELRQTQLELEEQRRRLDKREQEHEQELNTRFGDYQERADKLVADRQALETSQAEHRADLARLDRLQATLEQREKQLDGRAREIEQRFTQLQQDSRDLEESVSQLDEWQAKLTAEAEQLKQQKADQDAAAAQVAQRAAALEGQQAAVATLRTRLERMRLDIRKEEQQLGEQRTRQEELEAVLRQRQEELDRRQQELDAENANRESQRQELLQRSATLDAAVAQLRQAQESLAAEENSLRQRAADLDARFAAHAEQAGLVEGRAAQLEEAYKRVEAERQALRERTQDLAQAEQARQVLQEQLRRRSEELVAGQKTLADQTHLLEERAAALENQRAEIDRGRAEVEQQLAAQREELDRWGGEIEKHRADLAARELTWANHAERVKAAGRAIAGERKALADERSASAAQRLEAIQAASQARAEYEQARRAAIELQQQLPELELRAGTALERLTQAREQLRDHLAEVTTYTRQCQDDLESVRTLVQTEGERVQQQEVALRRSQDEHRLAVVAFRQQLIDWQAQVAEIKRLLAQDESRLVRQQARVEEQAREVDATTQRLAKQSEELEEQHRLVAERRVEMDRHLADMREWYRGKLRDLAGVDAATIKVGKPAPRGTEIDDEVVDASVHSAEQPLILSITGEVDPSDRQLGDLLRSLGLIESETLMALLIEARQQRRSLRQMLLTSGVVTLYQMALIEAGNLDALMLGPVRVVDRLRVTPYEAVYRVFDPRRGQDAVLRHLAEAEMQDAVHPDEFRQRFSQAMIVHPNLAATLEVLEISGRPAALQEWLTGLPSTEWGLLTSAPGVCFRLLGQAALGLQTAHDIGLMHGHLQPESLLLTADGILKTCGFGEPLWLLGPNVSTPEDVRADLDALGRIVGGWINPSGRRQGSKIKGIPDSLRALVDRLVGSDISNLYPSAAALLEDLDRVGADVPPNSEAWDRLLRHVRENALPATALRRSA